MNGKDDPLVIDVVPAPLYAHDSFTVAWWGANALSPVRTFRFWTHREWPELGYNVFSLSTGAAPHNAVASQSALASETNSALW